MKNVLVISQYFAPMNIIASIRFTKMVKFLARTGEYHFWIICIGLNENDIRDELLWRDIEEVSEYVTVFPVTMDKKIIKKIKYIFSKRECKQVVFDGQNKSNQKRDIYYTIQREFVTYKEKGIIGRMKRLLGKMLLTVNDMYDLNYEWTFARRGMFFLKQIPIDDIDVVISTYGQIGSLLLALKFKSVQRRVRWIVDYRDIIMAESNVKKRYMNWISVKADRGADYITGATSSCIGSGVYLEKFHLITNGFDREDMKEIITESKSEKFRIVYTGNLYGGKRKMTLLFRIIAELEKEGVVDCRNISVIYAGKQFYILEDQAKEFNMEKVLFNKGEVSRKKALEIQYNSDILCLLTWNKSGEDNWLTGKMLEYFMMGKPIFAIVAGDKPDSIVKKIIQDADLGYCFEEGGDSGEYYSAKQWFLEKYVEFVKTGSVASHSNEKVLEQYSSVKMALKFKQLIDA